MIRRLPINLKFKNFRAMATNSNHQIWRHCNAVCFDVDSTLCTTEMIDELAAFLGVGEQVSALTKKAMSDGMSFRECLDARLKIMQPTQAKKGEGVTKIMKKIHEIGKYMLDEFKLKNNPVLTNGVKELVGKLLGMRKDVYLVSGGFQSIIKPIAVSLGLKETNVYANKILFDNTGNYSGFDTNQPTSATGGKKVVVEKLISEHGYKSVVMIGDGMTDFEAFPTAELFIGFGGNVLRESVRAKAPWYVTDFKELIDALSE